MKIAYFAPIYFDYLKQRPQHFAELLSERDKVYYIEPTISLMKYVLKGGKKFTGLQYTYNENLQIIRANGCLTAHKSLDYFDALNINSISEYIQLRDIVSNCDVIWVGYPGWYNLISRFENKKIIYDKMDEDSKIAVNPLLKKVLLKEEQKLIERADCIFVSCNVFYEHIKKYNEHIKLVPNGVSLSFYNGENSPLFLTKGKRGNVFGYVGTISHWFDYDVIRAILDANERNEVVLVGNNMMPKIVDERIHYVDSVEKEDVPKVIEGFDVCLYNFKKNDLLETINPVKIYEYLALNKPVLSVRSRETEKFADQLVLYNNVNEVKGLLKTTLIWKRPFPTEEKCRAFIRENSWEERVKTIRDEIKIMLLN